ncbi:hypothetical protein TVAG_265270 [Trichomonas vaginalis G3]|uniref:DUF3447 domain-containing protein n=1 Tax=Trichomonas vaginalis (strain ATCC PRA-98 / G3) TaxID=412133 RepID=A2G2M6_TRIV3|nr:spectrin binding [Trichomonas vaginalis G3]EAX88587.1 hypothetical protein TVAG_265270 [Trichomonas vaginalis G3]KAI5523837.1 spectrin binding [Trichomonas vaginalis G3]|eukprot:XP_001301517.1 hypothetical protein [Trichomonas vaginalis G3]
MSDWNTMEAAIASHNFDNVEKLITEYHLRITSLPCTTYYNLYAYAFFLDDANSYDLSLTIFKSQLFHIPSLCEYLIKNGVDINLNLFGGYTALHYAVDSNQTGIASTLLLNGFDCSVLNGSELSLVISNDNSAMLELLASHGSNVNYKYEESQFTILHHACLKNKIEAANILISHGANINDNNNRQKLTPLMIGLILNHRDIIKLLISRGADINMQKSGGFSAIHLTILFCKLYYLYYKSCVLRIKCNNILRPNANKC